MMVDRMDQDKSDVRGREMATPEIKIYNSNFGMKEGAKAYCTQASGVVHNVTKLIGSFCV